jgi:hypothetical protein
MSLDIGEDEEEVCMLSLGVEQDLRTAGGGAGVDEAVLLTVVHVCLDIGDVSVLSGILYLPADSPVLGGVGIVGACADDELGARGLAQQGEDVLENIAAGCVSGAILDEDAYIFVGGQPLEVSGFAAGDRLLQERGVIGL